MHAPLNENNLLPNGPLRRLGQTLVCFDELDSTNVYALSRAAKLPDGAVVTAEYQTAGRGRLGHTWQSPRGASILLSVLLEEPADSPLIKRGTMLAALAACEAVEDASTCRPALRWPNDLLLSGRKLAGVLVESTPLPKTAGQAPLRAMVLGVGINCLQQRGHFAGELGPSATSLEIESPGAIDRAAVARALLARLDHHVANFGVAAGPAELLSAWKSHCSDFGRRVTLSHDRKKYSGTVLDITDEGDLVLELDRGGRRCFAAATTTRVA
jgi:BirA family transcriptional regulator, biotin operon repressor / biotin---[acetyl-CoA-carboxylase] ligase